MEDSGALAQRVAAIEGLDPDFVHLGHDAFRVDFLFGHSGSFPSVCLTARAVLIRCAGLFRFPESRCNHRDVHHV